MVASDARTGGSSKSPSRSCPGGGRTSSDECASDIESRRRGVVVVGGNESAREEGSETDATTSVVSIGECRGRDSPPPPLHLPQAPAEKPCRSVSVHSPSHVSPLAGSAAVFSRPSRRQFRTPPLSLSPSLPLRTCPQTSPLQLSIFPVPLQQEPPPLPRPSRRHAHRDRLPRHLAATTPPMEARHDSTTRRQAQPRSSPPPRSHRVSPRAAPKAAPRRAPEAEPVSLVSTRSQSSPTAKSSSREPLITTTKSFSVLALGTASSVTRSSRPSSAAKGRTRCSSTGGSSSGKRRIRDQGGMDL